MRLLGLDIGEKRIGIALSDEMALTAQSLEVLQCKNREADLRRIVELVQQYQVSTVVVGLPKNMDGTLGFQAQSILEFIADLRKTAITAEIVTWDERLSSKAAENILLEANMRRQKRKKVIDKLAAAVILQGYLDFCAARSRLTP